MSKATHRVILPDGTEVVRASVKAPVCVTAVNSDEEGWAVAHWHGSRKAAEAKAGAIRRNPWNRTVTEVRIIETETV